MKKSKINLKELNKDLEDVLEIVNKIDNFDPEIMKVSELSKIIKNKEKKLNDKDIANITNKANTLKKHITEKHVKNLDIKK